MSDTLPTGARTPLTGTFSLPLYDVNGNAYEREVTIERIIGEGGSCICYEVLVRFDESSSHRMILKQFYPNPRQCEAKIELDGIRMKISGFSQRADLQHLSELFERAYHVQSRLADSAGSMGVMVRPYEKYFSDTTKYILYETNHGESLEKISFESIHEFLFFMSRACHAIGKLHEQGILHMDLKPENILWVDHEDVKFFDFDSVIELDKIGDVHEIRGDKKRPQLLAPELRDTDNFEETKWIYLSPRIDIYSLGCMLFHYIMGRYPEEEDCRNHGYEDELKEILAGRYRKVFKHGEQQMLFEILKKSISHMRSKRYASAEKMAEDLRKLLASLEAEREQVIGNVRINYNMLAAYVLNRHPLYDYRYRTQDGTWVLDVVLEGTSPMREAFLKHIFACAQMLDTRLNIRVISRDAESFLRRLLKECPALGGTTEICLNGRELEKEEGYGELYGALDTEVTDEPLAYLYFYDRELTVSNAEEICGGFRTADGTGPCYFLLTDADYEKNCTLVRTLPELGGREQRIFIGYGDDRGSGYSLRNILEQEPELQQTNPGLMVDVFGCDANYSGEELDFRQEINRLALAVHTFYTKEWSEKKEREQILKEFWSRSNNFYNSRSSMRCALSIPYKLASCGAAWNVNPAAEFYRRALCGTPEAEQCLARLQYLEHRSWMCFMIMDGWQRPTMEELEKYAFSDGSHTHQDKVRKLHPCICSSSWDGRRVPEKKHKDWLAPVKPGNYDKLDTMSLQLHQICQKKVKRLRLNVQFQQLKAELREADAGRELEEALGWLMVLYRRMIDNETNINELWDKTCREFEKKLEGMHDGIRLTFRKIKDSMAVVKERNLYHDYKSSDITILKAIPQLLMEPIQRIYKLVSDRTWENIISALLVEPRELVLVAEDAEDIPQENLDQMKKFFEVRGLKELAVSVKTLDEIRFRKSDLKAVIDITGAQEDLLYRMLREKKTGSVPYIMYQDRKLQGLSGYEEISWYNQTRTLTVEETFLLFHANVFSAKEENRMLGLGRNYRQIWNGYVKLNDPFAWKVMVDFFAEQEKKCYIPLTTAEKDAETKLTAAVRRRAAEDCGIDRVLMALQMHGLVQDFLLPEEEAPDSIEVTTTNGSVIPALNQMIKKAMAEPYTHRFSLQSLDRDPVSGKPFLKERFYIKDNLLKIETTVKQETLTDLGGGSHLKVPVLERALETVWKEGRSDGEELVLMKSGSQKFITPVGDGTFAVKLEFRNEATKECLLKEGNVLEAYVYHSIRQNALFDDVKLNVEFLWNAEEEGDHLETGAVKNEIDIVCTKGVETYFISCKQARVKNEFLNEVKYYADYFGVDAKALIICSHPDTKDTCERRPHSFINRSRSMGVYFVNRSLIGDAVSEDEESSLVKVLRNIISGKKDWRG